MKKIELTCDEITTLATVYHCDFINETIINTIHNCRYEQPTGSVNIIWKGRKLCYLGELSFKEIINIIKSMKEREMIRQIYG